MASPDILQLDWFRWGLVAVISIIAWGTADYFLYRKKHKTVAPKPDGKPGRHTLTQYSPPVPSGLYTKQWVLVYNPTNPKGRKSISFNEDGTIGDGRNHNEWRWSYTNDHLDIWMKDSGHCRRHLEGLMDANEVVVHRMQRNRCGVVLDLL
ncbi:hypothetical protein ACVI1L_007287 [Bradyrhizobium sp. USDA 4516]